MSNLKELKTQIENVNALGRQNLTEKGVEISETTTTFEIMSKIADIVGGSETELSVEYIESSGTHCIDTGYIANQNTRIECKYQVVGAKGKFDTLFGDYTNFQYSHRYTYSGYGNATQAVKWGGECLYYGEGLSSSDIVILETSNGSYTFTENGITTTQTVNENAEFTSPYSLVLFCNRDFQNLSNCYEEASSCYVRLYYFKIYEGEELVRDFIPAIDDSGVVCLYDNVTQTYFYNQGTGVFNGRFIEKVGIEPLDHTVTFTVDGEPYEVVSVKNGNSVNAPATKPTKEGYNIVVWQNKNNETILFPYEIQSNEELTALFIKEIVRLNHTMTSDTELGCECFADSAYSSFYVWKAFRNEDLDGSVGTVISDLGHHWMMDTPIEDAYIGYDFGVGVSYNIDKVVYYPCFYRVNTNQGATVKIQGSNNKTEWEDISGNVYIASTGYSTSGAYLSKSEIPCNSTKAYRYVRVKPVDFSAGNGAVGRKGEPFWYNRQIEIYGF